jgi:hypothetical protein
LSAPLEVSDAVAARIGAELAHLMRWSSRRPNNQFVTPGGDFTAGELGQRVVRIVRESMNPELQPEPAPRRREGPWTGVKQLETPDRKPWTLWHLDGSGFQATPGTLAESSMPPSDCGTYSTSASLMRIKNLREVKP